MVSVDVKHHVYLLVRPEDCGSDLWKAADCEVVLVTIKRPVGPSTNSYSACLSW